HVGSGGGGGARLPRPGDAHLTPSRDPLASTLGAVAGGTGLGSALLAAWLMLVRAAQARAGAEPDPAGSGGLLLAGIAATVTLSAFVAWRRSAGLASDAHRAAVTVLAAFGALTVVFLLSFRLERLAGLAGLAALAAGSAAIGIAGERWAARARGTDAEPGNG
ncbi:MAG: hypothetical protein ACREN5_08885, partial [Gemmatimonadales bacterium]